VPLVDTSFLKHHAGPYQVVWDFMDINCVLFYALEAGGKGDEGSRAVEGKGVKEAGRRDLGIFGLNA